MPAGFKRKSFCHWRVKMKKKLWFVGIIGMALAMGFFTGCGTFPLEKTSYDSSLPLARHSYLYVGAESFGINLATNIGIREVDGEPVSYTSAFVVIPAGRHTIDMEFLPLRQDYIGGITNTIADVELEEGHFYHIYAWNFSAPAAYNFFNSAPVSFGEEKFLAIIFDFTDITAPSIVWANHEYENTQDMMYARYSDPSYLDTMLKQFNKALAKGKFN
jgi:hypothetical protein